MTARSHMPFGPLHQCENNVSRPSQTNSLSCPVKYPSQKSFISRTLIFPNRSVWRRGNTTDPAHSLVAWTDSLPMEWLQTQKRISFFLVPPVRGCVVRGWVVRWCFVRVWECEVILQDKVCMRGCALRGYEMEGVSVWDRVSWSQINEGGVLALREATLESVYCEVGYERACEIGHVK